MDTKKQADRIQVLVSEGMDMGAAIEKVLREMAPVTMDNRVEHILSLENLELLEQFKHKAHAKKSKMKNNPVAVERYNKEIEACKSQIAKVRMKVSEEGSTLEGLIKMGAKTSTVLQAWLTEKEKDIEPKLKAFKESKKLNNKELKKLTLQQSKEFPKKYAEELGKLGKEYLDNMSERVESGDQRVIALVRKTNLVS